MPDFIIHPYRSAEIYMILKNASYCKIPVTIWDGGSSPLGGALSIAGGIMIDMKRMNHLIKINKVSHTIIIETGMIFQWLAWYANERGYSCQHITSCLTCDTIDKALNHRSIGIMFTK